MLRAAYFNPDNIITDEEYTNYNSLSKTAIQRFLEKQGSELAVLRDNNKSIAKIFYDSAQKYEINPKLLLATAQKEQSAITDSSLTSYQKKYLMGYAVFDVYNPIQLKYQGIFKQIDNAAWQFRQYLNNYQGFGFQKNKTKTTRDNYAVTPKNHATAGLYNYTPHAGAPKGVNLSYSGNGNFLFWQIWQSWFANYYPNGTLLKIDNNDLIYILQNDKKRPFLSERVLEVSKYNADQAITISSEQDKYLASSPTIFPDGTLLSDGKNKYIVSNQRLRKFQSNKVFKKLGYQEKKLLPIDEAGKNVYRQGAIIKNQRALPLSGTIIRNRKSNIKYLVNGREKKPIYKAIYKNQFTSGNYVYINEAAFDAFAISDPVYLRDGTIIKNKKGKLFIIEYGQKRPISKTTFDKMGFKLENAISVSQKIRQMHETGKKIKL